jgi:hypothetical protein
MLAGEKQCIHELGPTSFDGSWALADIYDSAEQLRAAGKNVVVAWVKAHYKSAGREGNIVADKAAENTLSFSLWKGILTELPAWVNLLGSDACEEALWRLSKPFFRWGKGTFWIASTLSGGYGIEPGYLEEKEGD